MVQFSKDSGKMIILFKILTNIFNMMKIVNYLFLMEKLLQCLNNFINKMLSMLKIFLSIHYIYNLKDLQL